MADALPVSFTKTIDLRDAESTTTTTGTTTVAGVLTTDNTAAYTPTADYHPATKGYADSSSSGLNVLSLMDATQIADSQAAGTDGLVVWNAMLAAMTASEETYAVWPPGTFLFTAPLTVNAYLNLYAPSAHGLDPTIFKWTDVAGLVLTSKVTTWDGFVFRGAGDAYTGATDAIGVHAQYRFSMRRCRIDYWGGNGININGGAGNCNFWKLEDCTVYRVGGDGLNVNGADGNAGVAVNLDVATVGGAGIWDASLAGNTFVGCSTASTGNRWGRCSDETNRFIAGRAIDTTTAPGDENDTSWDDIWKWKELGAVSASGGYPKWETGLAWRYCPGYYSSDVNSNAAFIGCYEEQDGSPILVTPDTVFVGGSNSNESAQKEVLFLKETTTPTAETGYGKLYTKSDNKLYFQDGAGTEYVVTIV